MSQFQVFILAADNVLYEGPCESLIVPTSQGQYGILANHSNMISAVIPGKLTYRVPGGQEQFAAVSAGLVKVENNEVLVLVDTAERPEDIDANRAKRAAEEAKEAILQKRSNQEYRSARTNLAREVNRLEVKRHYDDARGRHM